MQNTQGTTGTLPVPMPTPDLDGKDTVEPVPMPEVQENGVQDAAPMIADTGETAIFVYPDDCSPLKWSPFRHLCPTPIGSGETFTGDTLAEVNIEIDGMINIYIDNTTEFQLMPPQDPAPDFV